jgi:hypothetical protein
MASALPLFTQMAQYFSITRQTPTNGHFFDHYSEGSHLFLHLRMPDPPPSPCRSDQHRCTLFNVVKTHNNMCKKQLKWGGALGGSDHFFVRIDPIAPTINASVRLRKTSILTPVNPEMPDKIDRLQAAWCGNESTPPDPPILSCNQSCVIKKSFRATHQFTMLLPRCNPR